MNPAEQSPIRVAAAILERDGAVLVCQRGPHGRHPGKWEFPGGKVEAGESPEECVERELQEELGIRIRIGVLFHRQRYRYPQGPEAELFFFHVNGFEGEITNNVFADIQWVPFGSLSALDFVDADRDVVARIDRGELKDK